MVAYTTPHPVELIRNRGVGVVGYHPSKDLLNKKTSLLLAVAASAAVGAAAMAALVAAAAAVAETSLLSSFL